MKTALVQRLLRLETAKLMGVNFVKYLREAVLTARGGRVLLPCEFAGA